MRRRLVDTFWWAARLGLWLTGIRLGCARVIVFRDDKILLVRHRGNKVWNLPGGGFPRGEDPAHAAVRELREELNLSISLDRKLGVYNFTRPTFDPVAHIFTARTKADVGKLCHEIQEADWFTPTNIPVNTTHGTRRRIAEALGEQPVSRVW